MAFKEIKVFMGTECTPEEAKAVDPAKVCESLAAPGEVEGQDVICGMPSQCPCCGTWGHICYDTDRYRLYRCHACRCLYRE
jgi:hypothetical protein